jgi:exonuclease VII small subunit
MDELDIKQIDLERALHTYQSGKKMIINFGHSEVRLKAQSDKIAEMWVNGLKSAMQCSMKLNEQSKLVMLAQVLCNLQCPHTCPLRK